MPTNHTATSFSKLAALTPFGTVSAGETIYKTACFTAETGGGWALQGFSGYLDGRLPTSDDELLRLSTRADQPGNYVYVSYLDSLDFNDLFVEDVDGFFSLRGDSASLVAKREITVPA